jgi:hypothetical protein
MKIRKLFLICIAITMALAVPTEALAKKKRQKNSGGLAHTQENYLKILAMCRQKYGNGYDVDLSWTSGHWLCEYRIN